MKRSIFSVAVIALTIFVYQGWFSIETPTSADGLNNDLDKHALAYKVIDGTPLILARFGDAVFLDTIELERLSMDFPPFPRWHWTGNWSVISDPSVAASVKLESKFGPTVLFGVVNDDAIVSIKVERDGEMLLEHAIDGSAYIVPAQGILLTDTVQFVDDQGNVLVSSRPINQP